MRRKFYLNKREGKIMGVCSGLADYTGVDALWIRIATALAVLAGFGSLLPVYLIVALVANNRPAALDHHEECRPKFSARDGDYRRDWRADSPIRDVETYYSSSNARLSREIDGLG